MEDIAPNEMVYSTSRRSAPPLRLNSFLFAVYECIIEGCHVVIICVDVC